MVTIQSVVTTPTTYKIPFPFITFVLFSTRGGTAPSLGIIINTEFTASVIPSLLGLVLLLLPFALQTLAVAMTMTLAFWGPPAHLSQLRDHCLLDLGRLSYPLLAGIGVHAIETSLRLPLRVEEGPDGGPDLLVGQGVAPYADLGPLGITCQQFVKSKLQKVALLFLTADTAWGNIVQTIFTK